MLNEKSHYATLIDNLTERAARATISQIGPSSRALREHLAAELQQPPGHRGSFLAPPIFESLFEWERHAQWTLDAVPWLHPQLVAAMDAGLGPTDPYRFPRNRRPYVHQVRAWESLRADPARSVVVKTGTASGKTECFLVPILNDLAHELAELGAGSSLRGVRALFLYPLNALIASQRDRLLAWTNAFGARLRFGLYNGETPDDVPARDAAKTPSQALDRKSIREDTPPILVTNATMLEYMMVRARDGVIIENSLKQTGDGHLRWIVLDEAHTYLGSSAAEIALLLRRVMHAFKVDARRVRFVATSATIGGDDKDETLRRFLADVAGIDPAQVDVIGGRRVVPPLPESLSQGQGSLCSLQELDRMEDEPLFEALAASPRMRTLREHLGKGRAQVTEVRETLGLKSESEALPWLDTVSRAWRSVTRDGVVEREYFLPLRGHFFLRTQTGLWACIDPQCKGRAGTPLEGSDWPFGKTFLERRTHCDAPGCGGAVYDVVFCSGCGHAYLCADFVNERLVPALPSDVEADAEEEEEADDASTQPARRARLIVGPVGIEGRTLKVGRVLPRTGTVDAQQGTCTLYEAEPTDDLRLKCVRCGQAESSRRELFRPVRLGGPFYLGVAVPAVLERQREKKSETELLPAGGRRMITFTDSRSGTARFALRTQLEAERNYVRAVLYHTLQAGRRTHDPKEIEKTQRSIQRLEATGADEDPDMALVLDTMRVKLTRMQEEARGGAMPWRDMVHRLAADTAIKDWMCHGLRAHYSPARFSAEDFASLCLFRELIRRPRRQNSVETLGLVTLRYPALDDVASTPSAWASRGAALEEWRLFLSVATDFFVRTNTAVMIAGHIKRWLGVKVSTPAIIAPDEDRVANKKLPWPAVRPDRRLPRLARMILLGFGCADDDAEARRDAHDILMVAWDEIRMRLLTVEDNGYRLDLAARAQVAAVTDAWICPVTQRILATAWRGISPYQTEGWAGETARCEPIVMPSLAHPFGKDASSGREDPDVVARWLHEDERVRGARARGVWTEFSDRIASWSAVRYFEVAEHSAQLSRGRLSKLEERFREGKLNLLSCSTTMEMGVDIGGLGAVGMNNAPPAPANYFQRAGRAGRREESRATVLTLCQGTPHGEGVFKNPLWPFDAPVHVPTVSLRSERIVRRHVHSLLLGAWLKRNEAKDAHRLACAWFFVAQDAMSMCDRFEAWIRAEAESDPSVKAGVQRAIARTALEGARLVRLLDAAADAVRTVRTAWCEEHDALVRELEQVGGEPTPDKTTTPMQRALNLQLTRLRKEYLLKTLAARGFLPSYGFPLRIVSFVTTTLEQIHDAKEAEASGEERVRDEGYGTDRGYPSRHVAQAIREYAPGSGVVIDGVVYESSGVTLNWRAPASEREQHDIQSIRTAWRCDACGACGVTSGESPRQCANCQGDQVKWRRFLEPAGFATDIRSKPDNDLSKERFIPKERAWISVAHVPWMPLANPALGHFRYAPDGFIFHQSRGAAHKGYRVCLECGYTASEVGKDVDPLGEHKRLRGGKGEGASAICPGSDGGFRVLPGLALGAEANTDILSLQFRDVATGAPWDDETVCTTVAVALRAALARRIGIDLRELGWDVQYTHGPDGERHRTIILYDVAEGGAGYVASGPEILRGLLEDARTILNCPRGCDNACHGCLLGYDTQDAMERLDRRRALDVLSQAFLDALVLPEELRVFGDETRLETTTLREAILTEMNRTGVQRVRVHLPGPAEDWIFSDWPLWRHMVTWASAGISVRIVLPRSGSESMPWDEINPLVDRLVATGIGVELSDGEGVRVDGLWLAVEVGGEHRSVRWAASDPHGLVANDSWGGVEGGVRYVRGESRVALPSVAKEVAPEALRKGAPGTFREVMFRSELDGVLANIGGAFWNRIASVTSGLKERFEQGPSLASVQYTDRYICSPLTGRIVYEVLRGLRGRPGGIVDTTQISLATMGGVKRDARASMFIKHDWERDTDQAEVLKRMLAKVCSSPSVKVGNKADIVHRREMVLVWSDGRKLILRPDHGFGFLRERGRWTSHDFNATPEKQTSDLLKQTIQVEGMEPSPLYVCWL